tara:strand:- start:152 stop:352 length:201 start_codon:yes stop_codon:yes gene_type:complete
MEQETSDNDIKAIVNAIAGGDNAAAQASIDQIMQTKRDTALDFKKTELAGSLFTANGEQEEVPEEE